MFVFVLLLLALQNISCVEKGDLVGCYKSSVNYLKIIGFYNLTACLNACIENNNYRYAFLNETQECGCTDYLGKNFGRQDCDINCKKCNLYYTGNFAPTLPKNLTIGNITETTANVTWNTPDFYIDIQNYKIKAQVIKTYASYIDNPPLWSFSNNTNDAELASLHPGTKYNITVQAVSSFAEGDSASAVFETKIGDPDNLPFSPVVLKRDGSTMVVALNPVVNNNGPITSYYVIVLNQDSGQFFEPMTLKSYKGSRDDGIDYYIAAEISPNQMLYNFTVGDGKNYGKFYNAPLDPKTDYQIIEGVVSEFGNITKVVYSNITVQKAFTNNVQKDSVLFTALIVCVVLLIILLSVIVIFYIFIRQRGFKRRLKQIKDNQELVMQGSVLEMVNEGYIPEDEIQPVNHYNVLKQKIWRVPQNLLKVDDKKVIGVGEFGTVCHGIVKKETDIPVIVVIINDKKLPNEKKKDMLRDLDLLIKADKHKNVRELLGLCESPDNLYVVLEAATVNLKDLLLGSRDTANGRFSNISESQAISFMIDIANGIEHLQNRMVLHKYLCARNIQVTDDYTAKISGFGLAHYHHPNMMPDYTRWKAVELFNNFSHSHKSNVWSFACIMWEISTLGATPYGSIPNNEIPKRIKKDLRLMQFPYIADDLYQLMLDCWQLDPTERPDFSVITDTIVNYHASSAQVLNFNLYPGFQYEQFYIDSELVVRTVPP